MGTGRSQAATEQERLSRVPIGAESLSVSLAPRSFLSERCNAKSWRGYTYKQYEKTNG
ncbi:hypothetical protein [Desulfitobacterium sp. LBE]|uniref:hypothetical protein n=1 Tax=Desulfitobacterium sp. LBE TaxID=884086 RepID=UPI00155AA612|nr:hypothetical protein [Desulfitobacterium sp. LBE]